MSSNGFALPKNGETTPSMSRNDFVRECIELLEANFSRRGGEEEEEEEGGAARCLEKLDFDFPECSLSELDALLERMDGG